MRQKQAVLFLMLLVAGSAFARDKDLTVSLRFTPQEGTQSTSPDLLPGALERTLAIEVEDGRGGDAAVIGEGTNDDDHAFAIQSSTGVLPYVTDTLRQVAAGWGIKTSEKPDRVLKLKLTRFYVNESNKAVGSMYAAEVKFAYVLTDGAGKTLIEGASSGTAHRYGRARSGENCGEVLSDSLKEAFANAVSDGRVQEAWASGRSSGGSTAAAASESVEDRLRKLDDLLKKGLITKDEYNKKRAEILKDI